MSALQCIALVLVAAGGTAVSLERDPLHQAMVAGFFGLSLAVVFLIFQAADVALSELAVGTVIIPAMVLMALTKMRGNDK